jgi:uncharacterized Zn-finger protein
MENKVLASVLFGTAEGNEGGQFVGLDFNEFSMEWSEFFVNNPDTNRMGKRYRCKVCTKEFYKRSNINSHMRFHSGLKPYSCS